MVIRVFNEASCQKYSDEMTSLFFKHFRLLLLIPFIFIQRVRGKNVSQDQM